MSTNKNPFDHSGTSLKTRVHHSPDSSGYTAQNSPMDGGWGVNTSVCMGVVFWALWYWDNVIDVILQPHLHRPRGKNYGAKEEAEMKKTEAKELGSKVTSLEERLQQQLEKQNAAEQQYHSRHRVA